MTDNSPTLLNPWRIGNLELPSRLIQGPLAGFSASPFRRRFVDFQAPAYTVSEMLSANDVLHKHDPQGRYLHRDSKETCLAYQITGSDPQVLKQAALRLQTLGADLIDLNAACPKTKIRKKGAGSRLMEDAHHLRIIVSEMRSVLDIPLTVKLRIHGDERDLILAQTLEEAGADALIIHARRWYDEYNIPAVINYLRAIKATVNIPIIANGDIKDGASLQYAMLSGLDGYMISRAGTGNPCLYRELITGEPLHYPLALRLEIFMTHLQGLADLEGEHKAILQSRTLVKYYFNSWITEEFLQRYYQQTALTQIERSLLRELSRSERMFSKLCHPRLGSTQFLL